MSINTRAISLALAGVAAAVTLAAIPGTAFADQPTDIQMLRDCNAGKAQCKFHPDGPIGASPDYNKTTVNTIDNCGTGTTTREISQTYSESTTDTFGVEFTARTKLGANFEAEIKTSYSHSWTWSMEQSDKVTVEIPGGEKAEIRISPNRSRVIGTWEVHYKKDTYYVGNFEVFGPASSPSWDVKVNKLSNC